MKSRLENLLNYYQEDSNDNFTMYALALEYIKLNDFENALKFFVELKQKHNEYLPMYYHLGKLYEAMNNPNLASQTYLEGMKLAEKQNENHTHLELQQAYKSFMGINDEDW